MPHRLDAFFKLHFVLRNSSLLKCDSFVVSCLGAEETEACCSSSFGYEKLLTMLLLALQALVHSEF